jgi:hypothetical protein
MALQPFVGPWPLFSFVNFPHTIGRTPWTGNQPIARPLPIHRTTETQNKRTQTSIPRVGFEPTIPAFERGKKVHVLDRAAAMIGTTTTTTTTTTNNNNNNNNNLRALQSMMNLGLCFIVS